MLISLSLYIYIYYIYICEVTNTPVRRKIPPHAILYQTTHCVLVGIFLQTGGYISIFCVSIPSL